MIKPICIITTETRGEEGMFMLPEQNVTLPAALHLLFTELGSGGTITRVLQFFGGTSITIERSAEDTCIKHDFTGDFSPMLWVLRALVLERETLSKGGNADICNAVFQASAMDRVQFREDLKDNQRTMAVMLYVCGVHDHYVIDELLKLSLDIEHTAVVIDLWKEARLTPYDTYQLRQIAYELHTDAA